MRLLVTGGAGFIGSNFVHHVLRHRPSWHVTVFDKLTYAGDQSNLSGLDSEHFKFVLGDICNDKAINRAVATVDSVVHFAAESHVDNSLTGPYDFVYTNVLGTYYVLEAVRRHNKRLHHISTDEVFGELPLRGNKKFNEATAYNPSSPYSSTKASADMLVRAWRRSYQLPVTISNCSNNYGPAQHVEKLIPRQITNLLLGQKPKLYGDGSNVRDWIHADDHSSAILAILEKGALGQTYLIGADCQRSNKEIVEAILELMGRNKSDYDRVKDRPSNDMRYAIDASKIKKELGWKPQYNFEQGLAQTIDWYTRNKPWWQTQKTATETKYKKAGYV